MKFVAFCASLAMCAFSSVQFGAQHVYAQDNSTAKIHRLNPENTLGEGLSRYSSSAIWGIEKLGIAVNCEPEHLALLGVTQADLEQRVARTLRMHKFAAIPLNQVVSEAASGAILEVKITLAVTPGSPVYAANSHIEIRKPCRVIFDEQTMTDAAIWSRMTVGLIVTRDLETPLSNVDELISLFASEKQTMDSAKRAFDNGN